MEKIAGLEEIGNRALWGVSSAKTGFSVENIRDGNLETFWTSDGTAPHIITATFSQRTTVRQIYICIGGGRDKSYTPSVISIHAGTCKLDCQLVCSQNVPAENEWFGVDLGFVKASFFMISVDRNYDFGKDCRIRQVLIFGPASPSSNIFSETGMNSAGHLADLR